MRQLTALDASFFHLESPRTPMHIGSVAIYDPSTIPDGPFDFRRIRAFIANRIPRAAALRERMVDVPLQLDRPYWINDPHFDLDYHIRHTALPRPGSWEQLCRLAAFVFAAPLDRSRPLWEVYVVEGLDAVEGVPAGAYALISKVHHAAVDGLSGVEIMSVSNDPRPKPKMDAVEDDWMPEPIPRRRELLTQAVQHAIRAPRRIAQSSTRLVSGLAQGAALLAAETVEERSTLSFLAPRTRFNGVVSAHRVFGGERFSLTDIKRLKNAQPGTKVNDIVLTLCAGAMRQYLEKYNDLPEEPLLSMVPVSVRPPEEKKSLGNQVAIMSVPLGTHIADPIQRLRFIQDAQRQRKELLHAVGATQLQEYSTLFPSAFSGLAARVYTQGHLAQRFRNPFNTVITNVPGPPVPIYNNGAKMIDMFGLVPIYDGMGLGHAINSYNGSLTITFNSCSTMMPDPGFYSACLRGAFEELGAVSARTAHVS